jgi:hypothetical protein
VWLEKVPFVVLSLIFMGLAVAGRVHERHQASDPNGSASARVAQACYGIVFYPIKTVLPLNLSAYYPMPERVSLAEPIFAWSAVATLLVSGCAFGFRRRWPGLMAVWSSYLVILTPNLGFFRIGEVIAADRYSLIAMLGVVVLLAAGLSRAWRVRPGQPTPGRVAWLTAGAGLGLLPLLISLTWAQCRTWQTSENLWTHALSHGSDRSPVVHNNLGVVLVAQKRIEEAQAQFAAVLQLNPNNMTALNNRAMIWATSPEAQYRDGPRAVESATRACELSGWQNAGYLDTLAAAYAEAGDFAAAVHWQTRAIALLDDPAIQEDFRSRLTLYQHNQPYHATAAQL